MYAFGICLWEMYTGQAPFLGIQQQQLIREVREGLRPSWPLDVPDAYKCALNLFAK